MSCVILYTNTHAQSGSPEIQMIALPCLINRKRFIVMMNEVPNGTDRISQFFENDRVFLSVRYDLFPGFFTHRPMAFGANDGFIRRQKIGMADRALSINGGQIRPECLSALPALIPDNLAGVPVN